MRNAHDRNSPTKKKPTDGKLQTKSQLNYRLTSDRYYLHYNNGVYMGGIVSYKRNGQGIVLLDDGTSAITDYCFDSMIGHNVLFQDEAIMSIIFSKNSYEIGFRLGKWILKIPFYEGGKKASGDGVLVDYEQRRIYRLIYKNGNIIKKVVEPNKDITEAVFQSKLGSIMDIKHEKAFKFDVNLERGIKIMKEERSVTIGFIDSPYQLQGLCFKMKINQDYDKFDINFESKCFERGYYKHSRLQNYGQRYFNNGNLYRGQFQDDQFEGNGVLIYPKELKWVHGEFKNGNLSKMINMNTGDEIISSAIALKRSVKQIHEYNTNNWMSVQLQMFSWEAIKSSLSEALRARITDVIVDKEKAQREQRERLNKIQQFFTSGVQLQQIDTTLIKQLEISRKIPQKITIFENSDKPIRIQLEPKNSSLTQSPDKIFRQFGALTPSHRTTKSPKLLKSFLDLRKYQNNKFHDYTSQQIDLERGSQGTHKQDSQHSLILQMNQHLENRS